MPISMDKALAFNGEALSLRAQRQQVIAANIANADTPNYKAMDFDFSSALQSAMSATGQAVPMARTHAGHLQQAEGGMPTAMMYRMPYQAALDGNTVEMDVERAQFADNAVRYEAALRFINGQIRTLQSAISGQ